MKKFFDAHNDCATEIKDINKLKQYYKNLDSNNISVISSIWTTELKLDTINKVKTISKNIVNASGGKANIGIEDLHFINNKNLMELIALNPVYTGLTWNYANNIAGGVNSTNGVTSFGKTVISQLEKNNIVIDTAHLNECSFFNLANATTKPLFCSHTAFKTVNHNPRNLSDSQLLEIVRSNGLVGICLVGHFLTNKKTANINDITAHINYFVEKFGDKNLCFGTDFYGTTSLPSGINDYTDLKQIWFNLKKMGYSTKALNKIFYENLNSFFGHS